MASNKRGGPNVKGTLGTLLRTTMHQVGVVKDAAYRQARTQRVWIDSAVLARRRKDLLADIGAQVAQRLRAGGSDELARWPELEEPLAELDALEADLEEATARSREAVPAVSALSRARSQPEAPARKPEDLRVWRPVIPGDPAPPDDPEHTEPAPSPGRGERRKQRLAPKGQGGISFAHDAPGGLDLDEDLDEYMHEDDVPEKA